ncbi:myozenin-1a [Chanos chanos]|uniref:Myozenin-1a n=1 Tax=Chanos chanos TaxID=29144 RepID=A0A6J2VBZ8_CHACN|nr:myozenin-1 [Chanos chanos]
MPLSGTPAPNKRKKSSKIITDLSHITQDEYESEPEASEFDLGTKIQVPKDIMLEELSLLKNKGSQMFKMRQLRVEKFIYENNPDVFTSDSVDNLQKFVPSLGGQMMDVGGHLVSGQMVGRISGSGHAPVPPPKPEGFGKGAGGALTAGGLAGGASGAGGAGDHGGTHGTSGIALHGHGHGEGGAGTGADLAKKKSAYVKTYMSPWERAMKGDEALTATMKPHMPGPCTYQELPKYKSFNRSAMPFGGFEKAAQLMTFQLPDIEVATEEPEPAVVYQHDISSRPSFNRTPIGWVCSGEGGNIHIELDTIPFDGETDDL